MGVQGRHTGRAGSTARRASLRLARTLMSSPLGRPHPWPSTLLASAAPGWNLPADPQAADTWTAFLFKPTFVVCVSVSPLPLLFI